MENNPYTDMRNYGHPGYIRWSPIIDEVNALKDINKEIEKLWEVLKWTQYRKWTQ